MYKQLLISNKYVKNKCIIPHGLENPKQINHRINYSIISVNVAEKVIMPEANET